MSRHFDHETERYLIGAALYATGNSSRDIVAACDVKWFGDAKHKTMFTVISDLHAEGHEISAVGVLAELRRRDKLDGVGGPTFISDLQSEVVTLVNVPYAIERLAELFKLRQLQTTCEEAAQTLPEEPLKLPFYVGKLEEIIAIETKPLRNAPVSMAELTANYLEKAEKETEEGTTDVLMTGFPLVDELVEILPKEYTTLAGRPGMGKSAFALQMAVNVAKQKKRTLFVSLETPLNSLTKRIFSLETEIPGRDLQKRELNAAQWQTLFSAQQALSAVPFHAVEAGDYSVEKLRKTVRYLKMQYGDDLKLVVVDYIQLMSGAKRTENRTLEVSEITRGLKKLAMDEDLAIVGLSQLSRAVEQRQEKRPMLSDLRESGSIEQDSNNVLFLYRHEYYFPDDSDARMNAEVIVAKNREGALGTAKLGWRAQITKFTNLYTAPANQQAI